MSGFGPLGHGGSFSSSSNLSHLAPPFTVDSYFPMPSTSSSGHVPESSLPELRDSYFGSYPYAFQSWVPSPTDVSLGIHAVSNDAFASWVPSPTDVSLGIHAVSNNASVSWVPSPTDVSLGIHAVPYHPASSVGSTTSLNPETHQILGSHCTGVSAASSSHYNHSPYYSRKPSVSVCEHSGYVSDGCGNAVPTNWFSPDSPVGSVWNGESAGEQWKGNDHPSYANLVNQGFSAADGLPSREKPYKFWTGRPVEPLGGKFSVESQCTILPVEKLSSVADESTSNALSELSRVSVSNSTSLQNMPHQQETSPDFVMESWSQLNIGAASYDGCFTGVDSSKTDPLSFCSVYSKPSLDNVHDSPSISGTSTTRPKGTLPTNMTPIERPADSYYRKEASVSHDASNNGCVPVNAESCDVYGDSSGINNTVDEDNRNYVDTSMLKVKCSSPIIGDPLTHLIDEKNKVRDTEFGFPAKLVTTEMGASGSIEHSSEVLEQYNLGVDSPCWKGASDSRYSLFGPAEAGFTDIPAKLSQGCNSFNLPGVQNLPVNPDKAIPSSPYDTQRNKKCSAIDGSSSFPKQSPPIVGLSFGDHCPNTVEVESDHLQLSNKNMIPCSVSSNVDGGSCLEPSQTSKFSYYKGNATSTRFFSEVKTVDPGVDVNVAAYGGTSWQPYNFSDYSSLLSYYSTYPSLGGYVSNRTDLTEPLLAPNTLTESRLSRVNVEVVNSMHRLSVLLLSYCSNFEDALKEHEHVVVQKVVQNLETCISVIGTMKSTDETELCQPKMSCCSEEQTNVNKGPVAAISQATISKTKDVQTRCYTSTACEEKKNSDMLKKNEDHSPLLASSRGDPELEQENMTKGIKKILEENIHDEKELDQQSLLYKNLWLEAEAALCSVKYKERFARMKIEMEKYDKNPTKGEPINVEKLPSPKITREPNSDELVESTSSGSEDSEVCDVAMQDTNQFNTAGTAEDTCASVMARFHILKSRMSRETPIYKGQLHDAINDCVHAEIEQTVSNPTSVITEDIVLKPQPSKIVNIRSANGRNPWPFIREKLEMQTIPNIDNYWEGQPGSNLNVSEQQDLVEFDPLQFATTNILADGFSAGDCGSPSSDWEHVLKEAAWPA